MTDFGEELCFELDDTLFGAEHFLFPVAQLGRGEAFGIRECLASLILNRHARGIRLRDLDVVTEDAVETDTQIINSAASAFSGFKRCDDLFRITTDRSQLVEFC